MKIKEVKQELKKIIKAKGVVPMLWGPPGIGKSAIVKQIAEEEGIGFIDLRLSLLDAVDLRGLPKFDDGHVLWARPEFIPEKGSGILFLDEITTALPAVQNAALQLVYDRRCGPHRLGDGWSIVCAGNRKEDMAHVFNLSSALVNRIIHINCEVDVEDVIEYGVQQGWDENIIGFLKFRPSLIYTKPRIAEPYASPRAYEFLNNLLKNKITNKEIIQGTIGVEAGTEFLTYLEVQKDLPDIDAVINGKEVPLPKEISVRIAMLTGVAMRIAKEKMERFFEIIEKFEEELQVYAVKILLQRGLKQEIMAAKGFNTFIKKNKDFIL